MFWYEELVSKYDIIMWFFCQKDRQESYRVKAVLITSSVALRSMAVAEIALILLQEGSHRD
jgi:hypothetical protein